MVLVEGHCHTFTRTTDTDAATYNTRLDVLSKRMSKVGIVAREVTVCSEVLIFYAFLLKILENKLLERKASVVAGYSYDFTCCLNLKH